MKDWREIKTPYERLRWARRQAGYDTAADASDHHDWSEATYRAHESGTRGIKVPIARRYGAAFGVRWQWLLTGEGSPIEEMSADDREVLQLLRSIDPKIRQSILRMIRTLIDSEHAPTTESNGARHAAISNHE